MISLPAMLVLEAKNGETGQHIIVDILEESSTAPAIPGEFLNLSERSSHQTTLAKLALYLLVLEAENGEAGQQPIVSIF